MKVPSTLGEEGWSKGNFLVLFSRLPTSVNIWAAGGPSLSRAQDTAMFGLDCAPDGKVGTGRIMVPQGPV